MQPNSTRSDKRQLEKGNKTYGGERRGAGLCQPMLDGTASLLGASSSINQSSTSNDEPLPVISLGA